ncbi:AAA family ATPase [Chitinibacter tainanensis]|uniref:AAA family ATPase n=1 Tax=Chitinibacter tainanensis TaxID=230667 RepID=UPI000408F29F|nr:AAA family ATPase [Chitinibacter tainanensis]
MPLDLKALEGALKGVSKNQDQLEIRRYLDTGFKPLNFIMSGDYHNGGVPEGQIVEIFGPSSCGKTTIATAVMKAAQQNDGLAMFMDHERSFNLNHARSLGVNTDSPLLTYLQPETWESSHDEAFEIADKMRSIVGFEPPIVLVFDSIAAMMPQSKMDKKLTEYTMNDYTAQARAISQTMQSIEKTVAKLKLTVLYLNQIRLKPGVLYGDASTTPGGQAMEFYATVRLSISRTKLVDKATKTFLGQTISAKTVKNRVTRPFQTVDWDLKFADNGLAYFDTIGSTLEHLKSLGKLEISADKKRINWQGKMLTFNQAIKTIEEEKQEELLFAML